MSEPLEFTGERFIPGAAGEIWYEHWHRYHFVLPWVTGRDVLDVACGAGYGSALLASRAASVVGADISAEAVRHARGAYAALGNLRFHEADCAALPFTDAAFDIVVSFETIEHVVAQAAFLDEVRRVLKPGGFVVLSCPNKVEYTDKRGVVNEFHVRELTRDELAALVGARFAHIAWYGQRASFYSVVWPEQAGGRAEIFEVSEASAADPERGHARPLYFIVVAACDAGTLAAVEPRLSVLADREEWIYRDYENVTRAVQRARQQDGTLLERFAALEAAHAEALLRQAQMQAALEVGHAERETLHRELARRGGLRWWLSLPLRRLWRALRPPPGPG
jgi:ubiquinone/menaquinone biosynthesis C-methylase UbiE